MEYQYPICKSLTCCPKLPAGTYENAYFHGNIVEYFVLGDRYKWIIPDDWTYRDGGCFKYRINNFTIDDEGYLIYRPHIDVDNDYRRRLK